jgi:hypothetical protein
MAEPSDLIAHYSSKIFQTRIYALTTVGAVLASSIEWIKDPDQSIFIGFLLILVVVSLGELNRRYTYSYICACYAASWKKIDSKDKINWCIFTRLNEAPWTVESWKSCIYRFMLNWSTYVPGIIVGLYLILREKDPKLIGWIGIATAALSLVWWIYWSIKPKKPTKYLKKYYIEEKCFDKYNNNET